MLYFALRPFAESYSLRSYRGLKFFRNEYLSPNELFVNTKAKETYRSRNNAIYQASIFHLIIFDFNCDSKLIYRSVGFFYEVVNLHVGATCILALAC